MTRDDMTFLDDEPAQTEQIAQGAIHDLWKGKPIEDCDQEELESLVEWVQEELQKRAYREAKSSVMQQIAKDFESIFGERSPF